MKILYITSCWTGFRPLVFDGAVDAKGMPAFIRPLQALCEGNHEVDMYLIHTEKEKPQLNINSEWVAKINFVGLNYYKKNPWERLKFLRKINKDLSAVLAVNQYDFIYLHGVASVLGYPAIKKVKVPYGHRLYGTFFNDEIEKHGYLYSKYRHYLEYQVFIQKKAFLLITDDGSKGDQVHTKICKNRNPYDFFFWKNGVDVSPGKGEKQFSCDLKEPCLFYLSRISRWKGQHKAIQVVSELKKRGIEVTLYLAGQIGEEDYYQELLALANEGNISRQVVFLGAISSDQIQYYCRKASASLSFYDMTNLGNAFFEYMAYGAVVIASDDGSLDDFIINGQNGFLVSKAEEAASIVSLLLNLKNDDIVKIRENAKETIQNKMKTWPERVNDEVALIQSYVKNH